MAAFRTELTDPSDIDIQRALSKAAGHKIDYSTTTKLHSVVWEWPIGSVRSNAGLLAEWKWDNGTLRVIVDRIEC